MPGIWPAGVAALLFVAAGIAIEVFFLRTETGQRLDASTFGAVKVLRDGIGSWADRLRLVLPGLAAGLVIVAAAGAAIRRQWRRIVISLGLMLVALIVSTALKDFVVIRPDLGDFGYSENTFPSGHTAVSVSALVAFFWLLPRRFPVLIVPLAALGALTALFQVASYAHRLSDVLAGALLAGALASFALRETGALRWAPRVVSWVLVSISAVAGTLCLLRWESSEYATSEQWTATGGIALTALACAGAAITVAAEARIGRGADPRGDLHR